jgi:hypothetical protein
MATYKTKCGLFFRTNTGGSSHYLGESWGEDYGKETTWCPKHKQDDCTYCQEFQARFGVNIGECEGVLVLDEEYDYENSKEKITSDYDRQSYEKIIERFGCACMAISADGKGGYKIQRDEVGCRGCWNSLCVVTNQNRDITKVRLMGDVETVWIETKGFLVDEHKTLVRKRVLKELVPLEFAERLLKTPNNLIFHGFKTNNCNRMAQELGLAPPSRVVRFYYEKSTAKRDLLEDLKAVAEGYTVIHDIDREKQLKEKKREQSSKRKQKKLHKQQRNLERSKIEQLSLDF